MKAILTRALGPTNTKGARIVADDGDGNRLTIPMPYEKRTEDAHRKAAEVLRDKMGWKGTLVGGGIKNGMAFVFVD